MTQEINEKEIIETTEDFNEQDLQDQKSKKVLLGVLVLLLIGCIFYYYNNTTKKSEPVTSVETITVKKIHKKTPKKEIKKEITENKVTKKQLTLIKKETVEEKEVSIDKEKPAMKPKAETFAASLKPSNRSELMKLAMATKGKADPFSGDNNSVSSKLGPLPSVPFGINSKLPSILPPPPAFGDIKLPSLNTKGFTPIDKPVYSDGFDIKGFIGSKVIVSINGVDKLLKINQTFRNVKVLSIDSSNLTAKFNKDGKIITKNMKSLTAVDDKKKIKLVKH